jgi:AcrR family transcriptional regulator
MSTSFGIVTHRRRSKLARALPRQAYHHGDARNALLKAASGLLERVGAAGLSLRQVAERAGLSRQAPYNHFEDKEALLAELVRAGFERLADALAAAGEPGQERALERAADAYIACAQRAPALFRMMFSRELVDLSRFPAAAAAGAAAFGKLVAIVGSFAPAARVDELSLAAWSMVHGYATLCIETGLEADHRRPERARRFARIIRTAARAGEARPMRKSTRRGT